MRDTRANYHVIVKNVMGEVLQEYTRFMSSCGIAAMRKYALNKAQDIEYPYIRIYKTTQNKTIEYLYMPVLGLWVKCH